MVPRPDCCARRPCRLPRTRGDGPQTAVTLTKTTTAPPHTRGWSPYRSSKAEQPVGSPAHAGMVPPHRGGQPMGCGLPRTRGDGPSGQIAAWFGGWAPPHTRGWSPCLAARPTHGGGSPAHAGMVPAPGSIDNSSVWLPRTRGDGPRSASLTTPSLGAPPHTRGWSLRPQHVEDRLAGSPAHAGMVPWRRPVPG